MSNVTPHNSLLIPTLGRLYSRLDASAETLLRVICGLLLVTHGLPKMMNPFGTIGMVESLGFYPGALWSPLLAATEFFGGLFLALGLLTRPAPSATTIFLLVTVWFNWLAPRNSSAA